ncbi:hypothetical protein DL93DRAFT_2054734, partial [Clavulina sp. PMI_390]
CKRKFDRAGDEAEKKTHHNETRHALAQILNIRLRDDIALTRKTRYGRKAIKPETVLRTWSGILQDEQYLPPDWLNIRGGVLVSITPRRFSGRTRQGCG